MALLILLIHMNLEVKLSYHASNTEPERGATPPAMEQRGIPRSTIGARLPSAAPPSGGRSALRKYRPGSLVSV